MDKCKKVGGQAVIEGVMMKSDTKVTTSVRKGKKIITKKQTLKPSKYSKWIFVRGITNLVEILGLGYKTLIWSANQQTGEHEEEFTFWEMFYLITGSIIFGLLLFVVAPLYLTKLVTVDRGIMFNLIDGVIRIIIFVLYILAISLMKDVNRLFEYHGAEHKAVNCYEAGKKLTPQNCKSFSTLHPRCGTSFLLLVLVISILLFSLITSPNLWIKLASRVVLIPVIASISYELLKLADKYKNNIFFKVLIFPGLALQKITTSEPDNKQLEVAIHALKNTIK